jgi:hypothetical protein
MADAETRARFRFGPRDRRGLVAGVRTGQLAVVAASLVCAVGLARGVHGPSAGVAATGAALAGTGAACWPVRGRTLEQWLPVVLRFLAARPARRSAAPPDARRAPSSRRPPQLLSRLEVVEARAAAGRPIGAVHDTRLGTLSAVCSLGGESFALLAEEERTRRVGTWAAVLASGARERAAVHRLQWVSRTLPDPRERMRRGAAGRSQAAAGVVAAGHSSAGSDAAGHGSENGLRGEDAAHGGDAMAAAARSYATLVRLEAERALRNELLLALTVRVRSARAGGAGLTEAAAVLADEVAMLERRCREAGLPVDGVLSPVGLRAALRRGLEARSRTDPGSDRPWPGVLEEHWASARTDGTWHATFWIAEWPRTDVGSDFLLPLLVGCSERRSVSVVMAPLAPLRAVRAAEHARTSTVADAELRRRHGFAVTARARHEHDAVVRRESELAEGHAGYRFSGYLTVSAPSQAELERACGRVEQAAALARLELLRLYGSQAEALCCTLPVGRGCA